MAKARSNYQQVRVTVTEDSLGYADIRVMVKPVDADWSLKTTVYQHRIKLRAGTAHWYNLLALAFETISYEVLPPDE